MLTGFKFPFQVTSNGDIATNDDNNAQTRGKIIQLLFTSPGERVNLPEFGCGLFSLVFEPNNVILAAALEFTVGQALTRWLGDELIVDGVDVESLEEMVTIEIAYTLRRDLS